MIYTNWYRVQDQSENKEKETDLVCRKQVSIKQCLEALYIIQKRTIPEEEGFKAIDLSGTFHKY